MSPGSIMARPLEVTTHARPLLVHAPPLDVGNPGAHCDDRRPTLAAYIASSDGLKVPLNSAARRMRARPSDVPSQR